MFLVKPVVAVVAAVVVILSPFYMLFTSTVIGYLCVCVCVCMLYLAVDWAFQYMQVLFCAVPFLCDLSWWALKIDTIYQIYAIILV